MELQNIGKLIQHNFKQITLNDPATFEWNGERVMVRKIINHKGSIMCKVERGADDMMKNISAFTERIQKYIDGKIESE